MHNLDIQTVSVDKVYPLRSKVLRPNLPIESCYYPEDNHQGAFHLAAYLEQELVGIASFYPEKHQTLSAENQHRLRGMAVEPEFQAQGVGQKLLASSFDICQQAGSDLLWCNARVKAVKFYKKQGFQQFGNAFDIAGIGEHFIMYKRLT
ncbi:GNAT family N-acetyltransferase [Kangiella sp. TOML190]|uniref:GNAT family N-acetyltransferase n=1 Tax=Kangiella sp. TOML190 TaxID=2931351 RepID=UPI002041DDA5|nr:GNAT family N-acetyltransferase [Kangiella sp. TOML190]